MREFMYWHVYRRIERAKLAFVWRLPRWLVYWCAIRVVANATTGEYGNEIVGEVSAMDALQRWEHA